MKWSRSVGAERRASTPALRHCHSDPPLINQTQRVPYTDQLHRATTRSKRPPSAFLQEGGGGGLSPAHLHVMTNLCYRPQPRIPAQFSASLTRLSCETENWALSTCWLRWWCPESINRRRGEESIQDGSEMHHVFKTWQQHGCRGADVNLWRNIPITTHWHSWSAEDEPWWNPNGTLMHF